MMVDSRAKGAGFEREIATKIYEHLGVTVRRDLEQYREALHGDLIGLEGWTIECKRYADNSSFLHKSEWWTQACNAARNGEKPVLIYKLRVSAARCQYRTWRGA